MNVTVPEGCRFCGGTLPEGRNVIYCPHCGNNLSVSRCPACGSELEKGWKFCATCGRGVGE
jgi:predicted amidophosphoribosyltransferase